MLKGEKVLLRPMQEADIARQHEFNQDPEIYLLDGDYPHVAPWYEAQSFYESRTKFNESIAPFAIEADGIYIGFCSLMSLRHPLRNFELGIMIGDRAYWGRGYGRDTVRTLLHYGFHHLAGRRIALTTHVKNERAIRCYQACGFIEEGRPRQVIWIDGGYVDLVNMSILRDEWLTLTKNA